MSEPTINTKGVEPLEMYELREITEMLVKAHGLHEGLFDLTFELQIALGGFGPDTSSALPGAMFGIKRIGIVSTDKSGVATVDAAKVNPIVAAKGSTTKKGIK
jgi:hypothetical protein